MTPLEPRFDIINAAPPTHCEYRILPGDRVQLHNGNWPIEEPRSADSVRDAYGHVFSAGRLLRSRLVYAVGLINSTNTDRELSDAARVLCIGGLDALQLIGEAYAVEVLGMRPAPPRAKYVDGWIGDRRIQVKTMRLTGKDFFGRITHWDQVDDILFVGVNSNSYEIERTLLWDAETARQQIETQPDSYWRGKAAGHYLTEKLFLLYAAAP